MSTVTITIASLEVRHELTLERNTSQFSATVSLDVLGPTDYAAVVEAIQQRINGASK